MTTFSERPEWDKGFRWSLENEGDPVWSTTASLETFYGIKTAGCGYCGKRFRRHGKLKKRNKHSRDQMKRRLLAHLHDCHEYKAAQLMERMREL